MSYKTCLPTIIFKITNKKKELWKTVRLTSSDHSWLLWCLLSLQCRCFLWACKCFACESTMLKLQASVYCVFYAFFSCFEQLFLCFTQFGGSIHCLNLVKFHDTDPLRRCKAKKGTFSYALKEYITARQLERHCRAVSRIATHQIWSTLKDGVNIWCCLKPLSVSHITSYSTLIFL